MDLTIVYNSFGYRIQTINHTLNSCKMKTLNSFLLVILLGIGMSPMLVHAQDSTNSVSDPEEWEFADWYDDTEDVPRSELNSQVVLMPNPTISGETMKILFPDDVKVNPSQVKVYDLKGATVSTSVKLKDRNIWIGTESLSPGIYIVRLTDAIKKKFIIR